MILIWPFKWGFKNCNKKYQKLKSELFFNDIFSIVFEGYFGIMLCCYLNFAAPRNNINANFTNRFMSIAFMNILVFFVPGSLLYILSRSIKDLKNKEFQMVWGQSYSNQKHNRWAYLFNRPLFCLRRLIFINTVFLLKDYSTFQLVIYMYCNLLTTIYQGYFRPQESRLKNILNLSNEFFISAVVYQAIYFTATAKDEE